MVGNVNAIKLRRQEGVLSLSAAPGAEVRLLD